MFGWERIVLRFVNEFNFDKRWFKNIILLKIQLNVTVQVEHRRAVCVLVQMISIFNKIEYEIDVI